MKQIIFGPLNHKGSTISIHNSYNFYPFYWTTYQTIFSPLALKHWTWPTKATKSPSSRIPKQDWPNTFRVTYRMEKEEENIDGGQVPHAHENIIVIAHNCGWWMLLKWGISCMGSFFHFASEHKVHAMRTTARLPGMQNSNSIICTLVPVCTLLPPALEWFCPFESGDAGQTATLVH